MDTYEKVLRTEEKLISTFNCRELRINSRRAAEYLTIHPDEVKFPLHLVYQMEDGELEVDRKIREDLSNLFGFAIGSPSEKRLLIFPFKTITWDMLEAEGCLADATVGKLCEMATKIHPNAKPVDELISAMMFLCLPEYYIMKFQLSERSFEIPDIDVLNSCDEDSEDDSPVINELEFCSDEEYLYEKTGYGKIYTCLPVWCYFLRKW